MLIASLSEKYGEARTHVLSVLDDRGRGKNQAPGPSARPGAGAGGRVSAGTQLAYLLAAVRLARQLRRSELVMVACHVQLAPVAWAAARASGAGYAIWCHGIEAWGRLNPLCHLGLRQASVVFAPSRFSARAVETAVGLSEGSIQVVPHGISPEVPVRRGLSRRATVCTVSRLVPANAYKGIDVLIRAWPLVLAEVPDASLVVVGDGTDRTRLAALADALDVTHRVRFTGRVGDGELADIFASAQVFALPSRHLLGPHPEGEGFGLAFLEASAAGLPVVAGTGGAAEEVVQHGVSGLLVDPRDERLVAGAIARLLTDSVLAGQLGATGQTRAAQLFSFGVFREAIIRLLEDTFETRVERSCAESSAH
jgi:phosphatidylinositol alpha-1,6-mannosyltransferase